MTPRFEDLGTRVRVTAPFYSTVSLRRGWRWKKLHDGRSWARDGLLAGSPEFSVEVSITDSVRIEASGTSYFHKPEKPLAPLFRLNEWKRGGRYFAISVLVHLSLGLLFIKLAASAMRTSAGQSEVEQKALQAGSEQEKPEGESAPAASRPFQGMSYSRFAKQLIETTGTAAERLKSMMGGDKISFGEGVSIQKLDQPMAATNVIKSALGRNVQARAAVSATDLAMAGNNIEEKDRVSLKKSLADLQDDMRRAYSRALMIDPSLAVTAVLEMTVQPSGGLVLSGFHVKGKYSQQGLEQLRKGVAELLRGVKARPALSGTVIRAESAFVH